MGNGISSPGGARAKAIAPEGALPLRQAWDGKGPREPGRVQPGQAGPEVPSHSAHAPQPGDQAPRRSLLDFLRSKPITPADLLSGKGLVDTGDARADHEANLARILACAPQMSADEQAEAMRVATRLHPCMGPSDPRIEATWHALTYHHSAPDPATIQALAAGFAGAYEGTFAQAVIAKLAPRFGWLIAETHLPFLAGCLSQFSHDAQAPGDLLAQQIEWLLSFKRGFLDAAVRREMLAALLIAQPAPAGDDRLRIAPADLDRILGAAVDRLDAGKLESRLRARSLYQALLPPCQRGQVSRRFEALLPGEPRPKRAHPVGGAGRPAASWPEQPPPPSRPQDPAGLSPDGKHAARLFTVERDGKADRHMTHRADAIAQALLAVFAKPSWAGGNRQAEATEAARSAHRVDDPPEAAGVVLQVLLRTLPKDKPSDLLIAVRALAGAAGGTGMDLRALESLLHALAVSPAVDDPLAGLLVEELAKQLHGPAMPAPLRGGLAGFLLDSEAAAGSRREAMRLGALRSRALATAAQGTQSRSDAEPG